MNFARFRSMKQDDIGFFQSRSDRRSMHRLARQLRQRIMNHALAAGRDDVLQMLHNELPGDIAFPFYAAELGGSIMISQLYGDPETFPPMVYGQGPLMMHLAVYNIGSDQGSNHFELVQSWFSQPDQETDSDY
eukprot:10673383-Karenia_brevis.AAC.1